MRLSAVVVLLEVQAFRVAPSSWAEGLLEGFYDAGHALFGRGGAGQVRQCTTADTICVAGREATILNPDDPKLSSYDSFVRAVVAGLRRDCVDVRSFQGKSYRSMRTVLGKALGAAPPRKGDLFLEFGAHSGASTRYIADAVEKLHKNAAKAAPVEKLHSDAGQGALVQSFDSFHGLPLSWDNGFKGYDAYEQGTFDDRGQPPYQDPRIKWQVGFFNETLPQLVRGWGPDTRIAFMHIDSDLYESARDVLTEARNFIRNNTFVVFDELVNYPDYKDGEMKALWEWFRGGDRCLEVLGSPGPEIDEDYECIGKKDNCTYKPNKLPGGQDAAFRVLEMIGGKNLRSSLS